MNYLNNTLAHNAFQAVTLAKINIAKKMILSGVDTKTIADITELNITEIENLKL